MSLYELSYPNDKLYAVEGEGDIKQKYKSRKNYVSSGWKNVDKAISGTCRMHVLALGPIAMKLVPNSMNKISQCTTHISLSLSIPLPGCLIPNC